MPVKWTINARRRLRAALARELCTEFDGNDGADASSASNGNKAMQTAQQELNTVLEASFPDASLIVVQNHMIGYRFKPGLFTLLVETFEGNRPGRFVVKIGPARSLESELEAWESCKPEDLGHDLVFLPLERGSKKFLFLSPSLYSVHRREATGKTEPRMSLVYGDAHQFLGVDDVITFEEAALGAIFFDSPATTSIGLVMWELYERIAHLLYVQSFEDGPADDRRKPVPGDEPNEPLRTTEEYQLCINHFCESLALWESDPLLSLRRRINLAAAHGPGEFLDPGDYFRYVQQFVPFEGETKSLSRSRDELPDAYNPAPQDLVPTMLRGCAHGDLHGRNILVGKVRGKVLWPVLFDYEDMTPCNLLGWDFVKLETELKIRAYVELFDGTERKFVEDIQQFEQQLGLATEKRYLLNERWGIVTGHDDPKERLKQVILEIRHRAAVHLGDERGRSNDWLEEYYFLLACYGICTARYPNQKRRERIGAFVSAGAAVARLSWPNRGFPE